MSKKVTGYLAKDGTFFEQLHDCQRHEALQDLYKAFDQLVTDAALPIGVAAKQGLFAIAVEFLERQSEQVTTILSTRTVEEPANIGEKAGVPTTPVGD